MKTIANTVLTVGQTGVLNAKSIPHPKPLVSVFMFCKNAETFIEKAILSVVNQNYPNLEIIIQDGASTDKTLDILKKYASRIDLISEEDSGPAEGFWKALKRCKGDIIGSCQADEEMLPNQLVEAVKFFENNRHVGALTRDAILIDRKGEKIGEAIVHK